MDNEFRLIRELGKSMHKKHTMHELSKKTRIPYATLYRAVKKMKEIITTERIGKAKTIELNLENQSIKSYLAVSSDKERKEYLEEQPIIKKIWGEQKTREIIALFGSYASKTQTEKSDIDLLIINKDGKKTIHFAKYETLFRIKINPVFITKKEFTKMLQEKNENIGKQALKNHVVLNNPEEFWELAINGIQQRRI